MKKKRIDFFFISTIILNSIKSRLDIVLSGKTQLLVVTLLFEKLHLPYFFTVMGNLKIRNLENQKKKKNCGTNLNCT